MSYKQLTDSLRGVGFTIPTPFKERADEVDHDALRENVRDLTSFGANLIIPCGNTGEYHSLSHRERVDIVETTVDAVGDDGLVVAGAGGSTKTVSDLVNEYERSGVDGVMVMHPSHTYAHQDGLRQYYRSIADGTELGVVLYKRSHDVSDDVLLDVAELDNVVAVKYAVNDISAFSAAVEQSTDDIVWSNGIAERFAPSYALEGAEGFTTGIGSFAPKPVLELMEAIRRGDWKRAREIRELLRPYEELRDGTGDNNDLAAANNVPAVKYGMELSGRHGGPVREPIVSLGEAEMERARQYYDSIHQFEPELAAQTAGPDPSP